MDVEFVDKKTYDTYILRVKNKYEVLSTLTNLNNLTSVKYATLYMTRKYRKNYVKTKEEKKEEEERKKKKRSPTGSNSTQGFKFGG